MAGRSRLQTSSLLEGSVFSMSLQSLFVCSLVYCLVQDRRMKPLYLMAAWELDASLRQGYKDHLKFYSLLLLSIHMHSEVRRCCTAASPCHPHAQNRSLTPGDCDFCKEPPHSCLLIKVLLQWCRPQWSALIHGCKNRPLFKLNLSSSLHKETKEPVPMLVQLQEHCAGEQIHHIERAKPQWLQNELDLFHLSQTRTAALPCPHTSKTNQVHIILWHHNSTTASQEHFPSFHPSACERELSACLGESDKDDFSRRDLLHLN